MTDAGEAPEGATRTQPLIQMTEKEMHWREYELRNRLEEDDARALVASIRAQFASPHQNQRL